MRNSIIVFSFIAAFSPFNLFGQGAPVPHIFDLGNPIISSEFNANFQELSDRNDTTQTQVNQNASDISSNQSGVSTIQGTLTQIQTDITNLQTNGGAQLLQFVGNSNGTTNGGIGVRGMTELCQVDYTDSRICTTEEYSKTTSFPAAIPSTTFAWILPAYVIGSGTGQSSTSTPASEVYSGQGQGAGIAVSEFNCGGWNATTSGISGLSVNGVGGFFRRGCENIQQVSCCR